MIYTVTLNPALDYILSADEIAYGRVNRAKEAAVTFGGKGINQSVMLRNLGVESVALGFAGGYTGLKLRQLLGSEGVSHRLTEISGETRINLKLRAQQETEINAAGPTIRPLELMELTEQIGELCEGDVLSLGGSVPAGLEKSVLKELIESAPNGVFTVVDADGEVLRLALQAGPDLVKPNIHEAAALLGTEADPDRSEEICRALQKQGAKNVLLSMGSRGAALLWGEDHFVMKAPSGSVKGTTGAGDSLLAGFLAGLSQKRDPAGALHLAVAAGSATAFSGQLAQGKTVQIIENLMRIR